MSNSRSVFILGPHRSGSSCVAGVCYHLGVHIGDNLFPPTQFNPKGHFEDLDFLSYQDSLIRPWHTPRIPTLNRNQLKRFETMIKSRSRYNLWGVKDPRSCLLINQYSHLLQNLHVITVERSASACCSSMVYRDKLNNINEIKNPMLTHMIYVRHRDRFLENFSGAILSVNYERLTDETREVVSEITNFLFQNAHFKHNFMFKKVQKAIEFVSRELRHW